MPDTNQPITHATPSNLPADPNLTKAWEPDESPEEKAERERLEKHALAIAFLGEIRGISHLQKEADSTVNHVNKNLMKLVVEGHLDGRDAIRLLERCTQNKGALIKQTVDKLAAVWEEKFSLEELRQAVNFYRSDAGKKVTAFIEGLDLSDYCRELSKGLEDPIRTELKDRGVIDGSITDIVIQKLTDLLGKPITLTKEDILRAAAKKDETQ